jgi:hypothetical protein
MANMFINAMTDLWTNVGTTYTSIKMNVTNTNSSATSKLMDLQVGGVSKFSVDKVGAVMAASTVSTTGALLPAVDDGAALGSTTYKWSDLYLANGSTINWGTALTATHVSPNQLTFTVTDDGAIGPLFKTFHNTASPLAAISTSNGSLGYADGDEVVRAEFWGKNASGTDTCWGTVRGNIANATAGSEQMQWFFNTNFQGVIDDLKGRITWDHYSLAVDYYNDTAVAGPVFYLTRNSATAAANDLIGFMGFVAHNNAATPLHKAYGEFGMRILDPTSTSEDGEFRWRATTAGTQVEVLKLSGTSTGATFAVPVITAASTATITGFNLPHGVAPTTPANGDVWTTTAGMFARISSATVGPFASSTSPSLTTPSMSNVTITGTTNTATGATWVNLGTVTTIDINGGTVDGAVIGGAGAAAITGTTIVANTAVNPDADGGAALGTTLLGWSNLYLASLGTLAFGNTNWVATHTSGILTVGTGDLRITTAGTNAASAVTVGGTQTLTNKTLTSPNIAIIMNGIATLTLPPTTATLVGRSTTDTLTFKTFTLGTNTLTGTTAEFNLALTDNDFATLAGVETLTGKTLTAPIISTITNGAATLTLPTTTDTLVGKATTDILTNKTLTTPTINGATLSGTIANGTFTSTSLTSPTITGTPTATGATWASLGTVTTIAIAGGTIAGTAITTSSVSSTTLAASGVVTLSPAAAAVTISPTGTGGGVTISPTGTLGLTINPTVAGNINNTNIGGTTRGTGAFTTLAANGLATLSGGATLTGTFSGGTFTTTSLTSPTLTGTPTAPTAPPATNTIQIATCEYVQVALATGAGSYQPLDATLTALAAYSTVGIPALTAADTFVGRTITGTALEITVTNGAGTAGNPTLSLPTALTFTGKTVTGGTFNATAFSGPISGSTGSFTTLAASSTTTLSGAVTMSPASLAVTISPTGTGTVVISPVGALTINPTAASTINNTSIGVTTRAAGAFTSLAANLAVSFSAGGTLGGSFSGGTFTGATFTTGTYSGSVAATTLSASAAVALSPASANVVLSPTGTGVVTINPTAAGTMNNMVIGGTTALAGTFTTATAATVVVAGDIRPDGDGGADLGTTTLGWANLYMGPTASIRFSNTTWVASHAAGVLTVTTGDLRIANNFTNAASVVTVAGTQTLTNKTLSAPTLTGTVTGSGAFTGAVSGTTGTFSGAVQGGATVISRADAGNAHFWLHGAGGVDRFVIYTDAASAGNVNMRIHGGYTWVFDTAGGLTIPGGCAVGGALSAGGVTLSSSTVTTAAVTLSGAINCDSVVFNTHCYGVAATTYFSSGANGGVSDTVGGIVLRPNGVGSATNQAVLRPGGSFHVVNITEGSDDTLKSKWKLVTKSVINEVAKLDVGSFTWKETGVKGYGVKAQALRAIMPEVVYEDEDGLLSISYGKGAMGIAIDACRRIVALEARLAELEGKV